MKFKDLKVHDKMFGMVYGSGEVTEVWLDGFYEFQVEYENGQTVPYTCDGVPGWGGLSVQTVFKKEDIDITALDISPSEGEITPKKIIKYREKGNLLMKVPSGVWMNVRECPGTLIEFNLENAKFHLFKKDVK